MNIFGAIVAGVIGTWVMAIFILLSPALVGIPRIDIMEYMGSIFISDRRTARIAGLLILSFDGAVLGVLSAVLWNNGIGRVTWVWGLIFGALFGIFSLGFMLVTMRFHPRLPNNKEAWPLVWIALILWLGHLVYGVVMVISYRVFP